MFAGRLIKGVKNGPSPDWLQRRLKAIGLRPISTLVDITNLVTFDLNRPLHVFDAKKLAGDLVMRQAREGEQILALDGKTYTLDPAVSVIADANGVHGIGFSSRNPRFIYYETVAGGSGGRSNDDGIDCVHTTSNMPIEAMESEFPIMADRLEYLTDSGGPGGHLR
mgnify:CR=1 FL=1